MKKVIVGVFAHPDDEAFGPVGTLIKEATSGTEIHLITLSRGEAGANPDNHPDLGALRLEEWRSVGEIIGATTMTALEYPDNALSNRDLQSVTKHIEQKISEVLSDDVDEIELMSFELGGITGHIDHIVAARSACMAFYSLKRTESRLSKLRLYSLPESWQPEPDTSWIFMDKGCDPQLLEKVDVSEFYDQRIAAIKTHHSQRGDAARLLEKCSPTSDVGRYDYFCVRT